MTRRQLARPGILALALAALPSAALAASDVPPAASTADATAATRLSLAEAVHLALRDSPALQGSRADARAAGALVRSARADTRPQVTATTYLSDSTMNSILTTPPGVPGPGNIYGVPATKHADQDVMLMVPLLTGGRLAAEVRSARAGAAAAATDVRSMELDVALQVETSYWQALFARQNVSAFDERVRDADERLRLEQVSFDAGKIPRLDLLRAQAYSADANQSLTNSRRDADLALVDLSTAIGLPADAPLVLTDSLGFQPETSAPAGRLARALDARPDLLAAKQRVQAAEAEVERTRALGRPQVYGVAMGDLWATSGSHRHGGATLGVTVGLPLWDGGLRRADREQAQARLARARADEAAARLRVESDVRRAGLELDAASQNVTTSQSAVAAAKEQYRLAQLRYESGKAIQVEVLDALNALTRARLNRIQALADHAIARDRLARAMGSPLSG